MDEEEEQQPVVDIPPVKCRICAAEIGPKPNAFAGHLRHHMRTKTQQYTKATYIKKFGKAAASDFTPYVLPLSVIEQNTKRLEDTRNAKGQMDPSVPTLERLTEGLSIGEHNEFKAHFEIVFQKVDRDEIQRPRVQQYCLFMVQLNRLLEKQMTTKSLQANEDAEKAIKMVEERIQKLANALGISRDQQIKNRVNVKSSPAALISGYTTEIERMPTEMLATMLQDEERELARVQERVARYILPNAPVDESIEEVDDGVAPDLESVIRRSGVNL